MAQAEKEKPTRTPQRVNEIFKSRTREPSRKTLGLIREECPSVVLAICFHRLLRQRDDDRRFFPFTSSIYCLFTALELSKLNGPFVRLIIRELFNHPSRLELCLLALPSQTNRRKQSKARKRGEEGRARVRFEWAAMVMRSPAV